MIDKILGWILDSLGALFIILFTFLVEVSDMEPCATNKIANDGGKKKEIPNGNR